ncbi:chemotaxis-specific protein-glutamate methyltransferase CheB [Acetobacteraceae bacterium H6797]|nr:chemotaxis-specific protein-glutamate methyltransferase CheB [Acetobacteraceae bacterium H6797]
MIKLLVVDDSALMRRLLGQIFSAEGDFELAFARDGIEALEAVSAFSPDVVTLDVQMPRMDGLTCLDRIMLEHPCPVVMLSSLTTAGADATLQALELGAVDAIAKPQGALSLDMEEMAPLLVAKVRAASQARPRRSRRLAERLRHRMTIPSGPPLRRASAATEAGIVLVGASTGGPPALDALLAPLPADFPWPIVVAQHMPSTFTGPLARRLARLAALEVVEVTAPMPLRPGRVYIGRGDADVIIGNRPAGPVVLSAPASAAYRWHPSADRLVESAMAILPPERLIGVLMTGMGDDGAQTMTRLREQGGRTIAEAEETAIVWGMPGALVRSGGAEAVLPLEEIGSRLLEWLA